MPFEDPYIDPDALREANLRHDAEQHSVCMEWGIRYSCTQPRDSVIFGSKSKRRLSKDEFERRKQAALKSLSSRPEVAAEVL